MYCLEVTIEIYYEEHRKNVNFYKSSPPQNSKSTADIK